MPPRRSSDLPSHVREAQPGYEGCQRSALRRLDGLHQFPGRHLAEALKAADLFGLEQVNVLDRADQAAVDQLRNGILTESLYVERTAGGEVREAALQLSRAGRVRAHQVGAPHSQLGTTGRAICWRLPYFDQCILALAHDLQHTL